MTDKQLKITFRDSGASEWVCDEAVGLEGDQDYEDDPKEEEDQAREVLWSSLPSQLGFIKEGQLSSQN